MNQVKLDLNRHPAYQADHAQSPPLWQCCGHGQILKRDNCFSWFVVDVMFGGNTARILNGRASGVINQQLNVSRILSTLITSFSSNTGANSLASISASSTPMRNAIWYQRYQTRHRALECHCSSPTGKYTGEARSYSNGIYELRIK